MKSTKATFYRYVGKNPLLRNIPIGLPLGINQEVVDYAIYCFKNNAFMENWVNDCTGIHVTCFERVGDWQLIKFNTTPLIWGTIHRDYIRFINENLPYEVSNDTEV